MTRKRPNLNLIRSTLPWAAAALFLIIYLVTLNHWVTPNSLPVMAKVAEWDWRRAYMAPVQYLLTLPFKWFPASIQTVAVNCFSAVCAALTLALLARSVMLLPQDRTRDQRQREPDPHAMLSVRHAWLPALVAVILCGLQLTFWENATVASAEIIDLLIFAYVIRCILEYRVSEKDSWLSKMALAYGAGVTNNWAMINYFPLFLIALVWIKGFGFFNFRFFLRMLSFGSAGLLLYFLLPAIDSASDNPSGSFFEVLKTNWRFQKNMTWQNPFARVPDLRLDFFTASLTSLLPIFLIGIRWPSFQGDISPAAYKLAIIMFRVLHVMFLIFTFWVFMDPPFAGRAIGKGYIPFLSFYYLSAMVTGYLIGYILLVFGKEPEKSWQRIGKSTLPVGKALLAVAWIAAVIAPTMLIWKNWKPIRTTNGPEFKRYATLLAAGLPEKNAVVLGDDPYHLALLKAIYAEDQQKYDNLLLETTALPYPMYHRALLADYPGFKKNLLDPNTLPPYINSAIITEQLKLLIKDHRLFYLHPSFGYFFENYYSRPNGLVHELKPYGEKEIVPPALTPEEIARNEKFWTDLKPRILGLSSLLKQSTTITWLGMNYSRSLNYWGVELQKAQNLAQAKQYFSDALLLNPENVAAVVNQKSNEKLTNADASKEVESSEEIEKMLGRYRSWDMAMAVNGPFDELRANLRLAQIFTMTGNLRQSLHYYLRASEISPDHLSARIGVIANYIELGVPDKGLEEIKKIRASKEKLDELTELTILGLEAKAYANKNDNQLAEELLLMLQSKRPDDARITGLLIQFYSHIKRYEDALELLNAHLQKDPKNGQAIMQKGALLILLKKYQEAVITMNEFLDLLPGSPAAIMNRAIAYLQMGKYEEAKKDYETVERSVTHQIYSIYYGLGEIAYKTGQKEEAVKQYERYIQSAPPGTDEYKLITERLKELRGEVQNK